MNETTLASWLDDQHNLQAENVTELTAESQNTHLTKSEEKLEKVAAVAAITSTASGLYELMRKKPPKIDQEREGALRLLREAMKDLGKGETDDLDPHQTLSLVKIIP